METPTCPMPSHTKPRLVAGLLALLLLGGCGDSTDEILTRAQTQAAERDFRAAVVALKALLLQEPNHAQGRLLLGRIHLDLSDGASAEKELHRARDLGAADAEVVPLLARALLLQGKVDAVFGLASTQPLTPVAKAQLDAARGLAQLAKGDPERAQQWIDAALAAAPETLEVQLAAAQLLLAQGKTAAARAAIAAAQTRNPEDGRTWSLLGDLESRGAAYGAATAAYSRAMALHANPLRDQLRRGMARLGQADVAGAASDADALLQRAADQPAVQYFAGLVRFQQGQFEAAADALQKAATATGNRHAPSLVLLGASQAQLGNAALALELAERAVALAPDYAPAPKLLATLTLQQGQAAAAERLLRPILDAQPDDLDAKNILATSLMLQGRSDEAARLLEAIAGQRQDRADAQLRAGIGLFAAGNQVPGLAALRQAAELAPEQAQVNTAVVATLLAARHADEAVATARQFVQRNPSSATAHNLLGAAQLASQRRADARAAFERALQFEPGHADASQNLAAMAIQDGDHAMAKAYLDPALAAHPRNAGLLYRQAELALREGAPDTAGSLLQRALDAAPTALPARLALARLLIAQDRPGEALTRLAETPAQDPRVLLTRAEAHLALGQLAAAQQALAQALELAPLSPQVHLGLARLYAEQGDGARLESALDTVLQLAPGNSMAQLLKVRLLLLQQHPAAAERLLAEVELPADDPHMLRTRLLLARGTGDTAQALTLAQRLFDQAPSTAAVLSLASAQAQAGDPAAAESTLSGWLTNHPDGVAAWRALSELQLQRHDQAAAVRALQQAIKYDAKDVATLNNLAWHLREQDARQSLVYAEQAYALAPDTPAVLDTYAEALARSAETAKALQIIDRAVDLTGGDPVFKLRRAEIHHLLGRVDRAVADAAAIAASDAPEAVRRRAQALLREWQG